MHVYILAALGRCCGARASRCGVWAFSSFSAGPIPVVCGLSCPTMHGIPGAKPGIKPESPAVEGRFSTTGPPRTSP